MRRLLGFVVLIAIVLASLGSRAGVVFLRQTSVSAYVGPGDIFPMDAFWGLQAVNSARAAAHQQAINIRRASDAATTDITVLSTGDLDVATATTFCAATICFVTKIYEQVVHDHSCDLAQSTTALQPQLMLGFSGATAAMKFVGASSQFLLSNGVCLSSNQPYSHFEVAQITDTTATDRWVWAHSATPDTVGSGMKSGTSNAFIYSGAYATAASSLAASHLVIGVHNGASSVISIDNANSTVNPSTQPLLAGGETTMGETQGLGFLNGYVMNLGIAYAVAWNSTVIGQIHANQSAYWGTP